ncbi:hypothetical protein MNBD_GAMMA25-2513 [hydrothermal vent metagenome]|uniref:Uncharacterized protein n=1 Tax=hydrothermal vent metagenome TaxID=652676 RepID=A0A3B1BGA2_9ZZZZ
MNIKFINPIVYTLILFTVSTIVNAKQWTLQSSIAKAMLISPELKQSATRIWST